SAYPNLQPRPGSIDPALTIALRVELLHGDETVARYRLWLAGDGLVYTDPVDEPSPEDFARMSSAPSDPINVMDPAWQVRATGDPEHAILNRAATKYWAG